MYKKKIPVTLNCGLDLIGEVLYGKWKIRLLYFIDQGYLRPSDLQKKIPDASPRVLFMQLKELENHGLVNRMSYPEIPPRVEYRVSEFGKTLIPVINALGQWADENQDQLRNVIVNTGR
jgi:DNA-binding HxlR family transcriptional regulator